MGGLYFCVFSCLPAGRLVAKKGAEVEANFCEFCAFSCLPAGRCGYIKGAEGTEQPYRAIRLIRCKK